MTQKRLNRNLHFAFLLVFVMSLIASVFPQPVKAAEGTPDPEPQALDQCEANPLLIDVSLRDVGSDIRAKAVVSGCYADILISWTLEGPRDQKASGDKLARNN